MKKVLIVLVAILLVFALGLTAYCGYVWYRSTHIFIQGDAYPLSATELDLRDKTLTLGEHDAIQAQLPQCKILWNVPFQDSAYPSDSTSLKVNTLSQGDLDVIYTYFPSLTSLDASGCKEYALLAQFQKEKPQCEVTYTIDLGGKGFDPDATELSLSVGDYDYDTMLENLTYLTQVKAITLHTPELTLEQIDALKSAYEAVEIHCTVALLGQEYDSETTTLDLSALESADVAATADKLAMLPKLETVELMDGEGKSALSKEDVKVLMDAAPQVVFNYTFGFYGETISTASEEVEVKNKNIGDENEQDVRLTLDLLTNCKRFVLDNCKLSNEVMAKIREDYRNRTKVVWRVWFAKGSSLTDAQVLRTTYDLDNDNSHDLVYCEDVMYMDIGHDEWLRDISFVSGMPNLEVVIISGSLVEDLTPFSNCKKLRVLEAAFCEQIKDLTPLKECESLEMLNISNTHALDLTPLDDLPLTNLIHCLNPSGGSRVPVEEQERFIEQHPDCLVEFKSSQPYGSGWRYDEKNDPLPWYEDIAKQFRYPHAPNNVGWYLADES